MKDVIRLILAILIFLSGCSSEEPVKDEEILFTYNETQIVMKAEAEPVIAALGEPKSYTEEPSCAFDGMDKTYYYGSFYMTTFPENGKDYVYSLWFADDTAATAEGIRIGDTQETVEQAYGAEIYNGTNAYILTKGNTRLTILLTDGVVSSVLYEAVIS